MIQVKSAKEIVKMMKAGELAAKALEFAGQNAAAGISTWELDRMVNDFVVSHRGHSPCKGYGGFPGHNCFSVNQVLIHGIPSKDVILKEGDILSCDIVAELDGYMGDNTKTFRIGKVDDEKEQILNATEEALYKGIEQAVKGNRIGDIGYAIQSHVEGAGYFVVKRFIGHGIGKEMHEDPEVPNFGHRGRGARLIPGMTIAIEPMVNQTTENVKILEDGWTVLEGNNKLSAHFEHTVLITEDKPVILTLTSH
ncbi:MAG: type I methionyl aminopeptidase [Firmicutes bacterium]|nr:type I methionyl aminopeptidase [[Eubacterium] siraeum]MCM1487555.1 type I methionyl aminopeptidase [Bacillota bacterium]